MLTKTVTKHENDKITITRFEGKFDPRGPRPSRNYDALVKSLIATEMKTPGEYADDAEEDAARDANGAAIASLAEALQEDPAVEDKDFLEQMDWAMDWVDALVDETKR